MSALPSVHMSGYMSIHMSAHTFYVHVCAHVCMRGTGVKQGLVALATPACTTFESRCMDMYPDNTCGYACAGMCRPVDLCNLRN